MIIGGGGSMSTYFAEKFDGAFKDTPTSVM